MTESEEELRKIVGVGLATAKKLVAAGYMTIESVARVVGPEELEGIVGDRAGVLIAAAKEKLKEEISKEVKIVAEEEKIPAVAEEEKAPPVEEIKKREEVLTMAEFEKNEQGPFLDLIDKITDKDTTLNVNIEDVGGKLFGRSLKLLGKVKFELGTLKKAE